jgi:hypothetical protein
MCPQCGAPVEVSAATGASPCRYCGAHSEMGVRDESLDEVLRVPRQPVPEIERLSRLRRQAGKPLIPPANVIHLFEGGGIAAWRITEAVSVWQGARREALTTGHPDACETVYFLAMALSSQFGEQSDVGRQRAVLESSLEALRLPRHRQALRCMLSRLACRAGDQAAAEQWLAPCDAASDDLEMDSPYRFSRALISTTRGDWPGVVAVLGRGANEVPILQATEPVCVALRANGVERMGDVAGAAALLTEYMARSSVHVTRLTQALDYWAPFGLCTQSRAPAQMVRQETEAKVAVASTGGGVGLVFAIVGIAMTVIGIGLLGAGLIVGTPVPSAPGRHGHTSMTSSGPNMGLMMPGGILLLMGLIFSGVGLPIYFSGARARRLALTGERATAQILDVRSTGLQINNVPQYAVTLLVQRAGAPAYQATTKVLGGVGARAGATVGVRVDPAKPSDVLIERG